MCTFLNASTYIMGMYTVATTHLVHNYIVLFYTDILLYRGNNLKPKYKYLI